MLDPIRQTILYDQNAIYYGYPISKLMARAGEGIAKALLKKYGPNKKIGFFCGPGNNGGDGFAGARCLGRQAEVAVYLVSSSKDIRTSESKLNWRQYKGFKKDNARAKDIPNNFDVVVECLFGTGVKKPIREPYKSIITKLNRLPGKKVTIDLPAPGFKSEFNISMMFPKTPRAMVVDIGFPPKIAEKVGVGEVKVLNLPQPNSKKGDNGKLLIIGGNKQFHGAPLLAASVASRIVDLVYFSSVEENNEVAQKMKSKLAEFITVSRDKVYETAQKADVVLIGPGLGVDDEARKLTNGLLQRFPKKKFVLDADALKVVELNLLRKDIILTPHRGEFKTLFKCEGNKSATLSMAKKYGCVILLKGREDYIADGNEVKINKTGHLAMTKGGTGDVLAGLVSALATTNESFLAATSGAFLNGLSGERLHKKHSIFFNASDLVAEIPGTLKWAMDFSR